jgi:phenylpyruvate tautomerase PptA (4-oxalocrotonate tautomerase family)
MPTYNCFTSPGKLTLVQKKEIARVCTDVYHEEFCLGRYLIQMIFCDIAKDDRYIAGEAARPDLVWIPCDVREGRNEEMKATLLHRGQQGIAKVAKIPEESIWFYLCDLPSMNIMGWGQIMPPLRTMPDDDVVFNALSAPLQASLRPFANESATTSAAATTPTGAH